MIKNSINLKNVYIILTFVFFSIGIFFYSIAINQYQIKVSSRAEFNGTACNDNVGSTLNSQGQTNFTITCTGNLQRDYSYVLFHCPEKTTGASYCGDIRDINSNQAIVIDGGSARIPSPIPSSISKSTDKNCGCVQWDIGVYDAQGVEGVAGGAIICAENACAPSPTNTQAPTNTPGPTNPPGPTNTLAPTNPPATPVPPTPTLPPPTPTPTVTNTPTATPTATATPSPTNSPTPTSSNTPTPTITRTPTPTRTNTPVPTWTQVPTWTPAATFTSEPTYTKIPTPVKNLSVGEQKPGFDPIYIILIPVVGLIIGLLL